MPTPNEEQRASILHGKGPLLIIAGAGTGKTTVITERIAHLVLQKKVHPSRILALTFTEKAATEMEERVDIAMPLGFGRVWIETFHGFCDRILRQEAIHIGLTPDYKLLTETEAVYFLRKNIFSLQLDYFKPLGNPNKFIQSLLQHFSRLQDEDIQPIDYIQWVKDSCHPELVSGSHGIPDQVRNDIEIKEEELKKYQELANAYDIYTKLKKKEGVMDFGDLITNALTLFRKRQHILAQYQKQFEYLLVDEFQDTNFAQNQLAILLSGKEQNITVVADDDQSIYAFRGSSFSNVLEFKTNFPAAKIITLTTNYRSTQTILDAAYNLIQNNNPDRLEIKEKINKKLISIRKAKEKDIELIITQRGEQEVERVIKEIYSLIKKEKYSYKDIAILVRANDHATPFMQAFDREQIPYQFLGPGNLFHQEIIKDLIAYAKILCNFEDETSIYRILNIPTFSINPTTIATLLNTAKKRNQSIFELLPDGTLRIPASEKEKLTKLHEMISKHVGLVAKESAGHIFYTFLKESGLLHKLVESPSQQDQEKVQIVATFFEKIKAYENIHDDASLFAVVDWIDLSMHLGETPLMTSDNIGNTDAINILTVHGSKGLEFPIVFLVNLIRDRFPSRERKEMIPIPSELIKEKLPEGDFHLQEERRLFYVAMTRAKNRLFFAASTFYGEGKRERKLSPFIFEALGLEKVEKLINKQKTTNQLSLLEFLQPSTHGEQKKSSINHKPYAINYLSYSQIQTFDICPLHYKLRYILKIPTPQTASQSFGTSIHAVLRDYYQNIMIGNTLSDNQINDLLKINWIREGYTNSQHERESFAKAQEVLHAYLKKHSEPSKPLALELPFEFPLQGIRIGGRIDRIDTLSSGNIEIIDYKTGNNIPTEKEVAKNLQLTTYALAATLIQNPQISKSPDKIILTLDFVEAGKKFSTTRTQEDLELAKTYLLEKSQEIAGSDFICSRSIFCQNCEYKMMCKTD